RAAEVPVECRERLLDPLDALFGIWVACEPCRQRALAGRLARALKLREHVGHFAHVVILFERIPEAEVIGLPLGITAVAQEQQLESGARELPELCNGGHEDRAES